MTVKIEHAMQKRWVAVSGWIWLAMGSLLLYKGIWFVAEAVVMKNTLCDRMQSVFGTPERAAVWLIVSALLVGFFKSRFVFKKTVRRVISRITSLPLPIRFQSVYAPSYWILIGCMMSLGMAMRFLPIAIDVRGWIDIAVGSALIYGAIFYFKEIWNS